MMPLPACGSLASLETSLLKPLAAAPRKIAASWRNAVTKESNLTDLKNSFIL
jgi:hypothetical protein